MARLKLQPDPTFRAKVAIPVPGSASVDVEFTFKHRSKDELKTFIDASKGREDADTIMEMTTGWELADAFTRDNVELLVQNYVASPRVIFETYIDEHAKAKEKNSDSSR